MSIFQTRSREAENEGEISETMEKLAKSLTESLDLEGFLSETYAKHKEISFTSGALLMLLIPLFEARQSIALLEDTRFVRTLNVRQPTVESSLTRMIEEVVDSPAAVDSALLEVQALRDEPKRRTSLSVIQAFWKNFCSIPPFCAGRGENR